MENITNYEAYENLANAVVIQAVKDLVELNKKKKKLEEKGEPVPHNLEMDIKAYENWFVSQYYDIFSKIPGKWLLSQIVAGNITEETIIRGMASKR